MVNRIRIAHVGDPQLGFSRLDIAMRDKSPDECYAVDLRRTEEVIVSVNSEKPDLIIISGDMVDLAEDMTRDWPRLIGKFDAPVICTVGNHDMGNNPTRKNYERYLSVFGYDHTVTTIEPFVIIAANSQFTRETVDLEKEQSEHERWFFNELESVTDKGLVPIVATHIGPFVHSRGEGDGYENFPKNSLRERVLAACENAGVRFWLAGHTHSAFLHMDGKMTILNAQSLSCNFDNSPRGWHLFELDESGDWSWNLRM